MRTYKRFCVYQINKKTLTICCGIYLISKVIFWQAGCFSDFLLERILLSISSAGISGVDMSLLYRFTHKKDFQKVCGIYESLGMGGLLCASLLFTMFFREDYRAAAFFTIFSYAGAFFCTLFLSSGQPHPIPRKTVSPFTTFSGLLQGFSRNPLLLFLLAGSALLSEVCQNVTVFLSQLQYVRCSTPVFLMGVFYMITCIAGLSGIFSHVFTKKAGEAAFSSLCFLAPACFCFLLCFTKNPVLSLLCIAGIRLFVSLFQPLQIRFQNEAVSGTGRAAALSFQAVILETTGALISPVYGALADKSLVLSFAAAGISCLAAYGMFRMWWKHKTDKNLSV